VSDPRQKLITDAVVARAGTLANLQIFRGEIDAPITLLANTDRIGRYLVIYPFGGTDGPDRNLADAGGDLTYGFQATVAAGFEADCEYLVDQVRGLFNRWVPAVTGVVFGAFRPPVGYQPGPVRRDDDVSPPRFWLPLQYVTTATTT
jgi:hypothetical protein